MGPLNDALNILNSIKKNLETIVEQNRQIVSLLTETVSVLKDIKYRGK